VNIGKMMQQARKMQESMKALQLELEQMEVTGEAGGGMVKVTMNGQKQARQVVIEDKLWDEQDKALIEDLVAAAFNQAVEKAEFIAKQEQEKLMSGLPLPPGFSL